MTYEQGVDALDSIIRWAAEHGSETNEATTRLQLIDRLLIECLAWPHHHVETERYFRGEYSDYELGSPAKQLVVEAKRVGKSFELPKGFGQDVCRLSTLFELSGDVRAAVDQVARYAQTRGIPIAAISNGYQVIAFLASRQDGLPPEAGNALVFASLQDMRERFQQLWNALSVAGVAARHLTVLLAANKIQPPPERLSSRLPNYPGYKNRNPLAADLQILGGLFIEDIARMSDVEEEFVRDTYCESGALSQYALVSREILNARYASYFQKETRITVRPVRTKKGIDAELRQDLIAAAMSQRPILLVGDVGVGKSMFIKHLVYVDAREELQRAIVLYVDFGSKPAVATDLQQYVIMEFARQLRDGYGTDVDERNFVRGVYNLELLRFESGIYGDLKEIDPTEFRKRELEFLGGLISDREQHFRACLGHIVRGQKRQVVVFLDNVDQRPLDFQEQVFLMGQSFAQTWPVTVFVALRPDTFSTSRDSGSLSGYQPRVFTIDPPRVDRVIDRRLDFALKQLQETGRLPTFPAGFKLNSTRLEQYIKMLGMAFHSANDVIEFVDNMSNGNLRSALNFIATFVGSAHVDTEKIFRALEQQGRYVLPLHEFLRAVTMQDNEHYDPRDSPILNVFDISTSDRREHFLVLLLLSYVERAGSVGGTEGFVGVDKIFNFLQERGFSEQQISSALARSVGKHAIATPKVPSASVGDRYRITTAGAYTAKRLVTIFAYVDAMIVDTPVVLEDFRITIHEEPSTEGRVLRAVGFIDYLNSCWEESFNDTYDWPAQSARLLEDTRRVGDRIGVNV